jgi:putative membrane protein
VEQSRNDQVKRIARSIENDHNALLRQLQTLARSGNMPSDSIPTMESDEAKSHLDMMKGTSGQEFDNQWLQKIHAIHEQKIRWFEQAEANNSIQDTELREWVRKTLPTLRKHRDQIAQAMSSTNK